jgi:hypothetical protein
LRGGINWLMGLLFIFTGLAMCYFLGYRERQLGEAASEVPKPLSLQQLIDRGPGGNPHVEVRDFRLLTGPGEYVVVANPSSQRWEQAYIPAVPSAGPEPPAAYAVVRSTRLRDLEGVRDLSQRPTLRGMVVNALDPMPAGVNDRLAQQYPGIDFATCVILEEGATPPSPGRAVAGWAGGLVFCALGWLAIRRELRVARR